MAVVLEHVINLGGAMDQTGMSIEHLCGLVEEGFLTPYVYLGEKEGLYACSNFFSHFHTKRGYFHWDYEKAGNSLCFDCRELQPFIDKADLPSGGLCSKPDPSFTSPLERLIAVHDAEQGQKPRQEESRGGLSQKTLLTVIAGLSRGRLDWGERETTGKLRSMVESAGLEISDDTIVRLKKEMCDFLNKYQS